MRRAIGRVNDICITTLRATGNTAEGARLFRLMRTTRDGCLAVDNQRCIYILQSLGNTRQIVIHGVPAF